MKSKTKPQKLNTELIGIYEYKSVEKTENHYIVIDSMGGKLNGIYFGTEDSGGHGVFFYGNEMENLIVENNKISFEIGKRKLYESTRFRIVKHGRDMEKDSESGISKNRLKYSGEILKDRFRLTCESQYEECWEGEMIFEKPTR